MLEIVIDILLEFAFALFFVFTIGLLLASIILHGHSQRSDKIIRDFFARNGYENIEIKASGFYSFQDKALLKKIEEELDKPFSAYGSNFIRAQCYKVIIKKKDIFHVIYHLSKTPFAKATIYLDRELNNKS